MADLSSLSLKENAIPLPSANTLSHLSFSNRRFGRIREGDGSIHFFNPQTLLIKFGGNEHVAVLRVPADHELEAQETLSKRKDVEFVELDTIQQRQFTPNDPALETQWHHQIIGSFQGWNSGLGHSAVRIAIVDAPFQMNHPDLAVNTVPGWDIIENQPITASSGITHSTLCAGLAAAIVNNHTGVAGMGNFSILPININGAISEMYNAIIWAADHDVRVVNVSWTGADSPSLNEAGEYLKNKTRGILGMAGVNGTGFLNYPNHPNIHCISMTDAADNMRSRHGNHIDFSAPGWDIFSTTTNSSYAANSGTSFSTPVFCGVVAALFSINPALSPDEVVQILQETATDKGSTGWDQYFGWGRIDFARAGLVAQQTVPSIIELSRFNGFTTVSIPLKTNFTYALWKTYSLAPSNWFCVSNAIPTIDGNNVSLSDPAVEMTNAFYKVQLNYPR